MKLSLSKNISKLRKEHSMTQEQLAEALGVTFASVSKWERGVATPELSLIAEMADLFSVSMDTIVGFKAQSGSICALMERILELQREKKYSEAMIEAEKALLRYPNDFRLVHCCGELYAVAGWQHCESQYLLRGIKLLEHSMLLLSQNTNPEISDITIQNMIAQCHNNLGQKEKGIEILKKYNVGGIHDDLIALIYTEKDTQIFDPKDAEEYMMRSFGNIIMTTVRTMMAYANYYYKMKDYISSLETLHWLVDFLQGVKTDKKSVAYVDRIIAPCYAECANISLLLGEKEKTERYLRLAYDVATAFDASPTYTINNIKFCVGDTSKTRAYDDIGESVVDAMKKQIRDDDNLYNIWQEIVEKAKTEVQNETTEI